MYSWTNCELKKLFHIMIKNKNAEKVINHRYTLLE